MLLSFFYCMLQSPWLSFSSRSTPGSWARHDLFRCLVALLWVLTWLAPHHLGLNGNVISWERPPLNILSEILYFHLYCSASVISFNAIKSILTSSFIYWLAYCLSLSLKCKIEEVNNFGFFSIVFLGTKHSAGNGKSSKETCVDMWVTPFSLKNLTERTDS